jgi:RNA polymerase sigma-70 factor (ECF subfamily)
MVTTDTDELLLALLGKGNEKALELIFIKYYSYLCEYAFDITKNRGAAEEIASDVFFQLWRRQDSLGVTGSLKAYLYTATRNTALNYLRTQKMQFSSITKTSYSLQSNTPNPYEQIKNQEVRYTLDQMIEQLPRQRRTIFQMRWLEGLNISQIALQLGLSESTVKNQLQSAQHSLKAQLPHVLYQMMYWLVASTGFCLDHFLTIS